jgi:hypothetical protein
MTVNIGGDLVKTASDTFEALKDKAAFGIFNGSVDTIKNAMLERAISKIKFSVTGLFSSLVRWFKVQAFMNKYENNPEFRKQFEEAATIVYNAHQYDQSYARRGQKTPSEEAYNKAVSHSLLNRQFGIESPDVEQKCLNLRVAVLREKAQIFTQAEKEAYARADKVREGDRLRTIELNKQAWKDLENQK